MEDIVVVQSQDYAQIIFEDLNECYPEQKDLECLFSLNEFVQIDKNDWIGIYKVGFSNYKDFICKMDVNSELISESKGRVVFPNDQIPKDDGEFYQFVYISQSKQIRGASIPFQFKKIHLSDFIEIEDQEAIIYKSKEESLNELQQRNEHLNLTNKTQLELLNENEEIIQNLKEELSTIKLRCLKFSMDNDRLNNTLKIKCENLHKLQEEFDVLKEENSNSIKTIECLTNENANLSNRIVQMSSDKIEYEQNYNNLCQELNLTKDKLNAAEQCKELLRAQLNDSDEKFTNLNLQFESLNENLRNSDLKLVESNEKFQNFKLSYEQKINELNGSYYALKLAHTHLENKLKNNDKDKEKLKFENDELKDRLKTGAKEYAKLLEKYRNCKNKNLDLCGKTESSLTNSVLTESSLIDALLNSSLNQVSINNASVVKEEENFEIRKCDLCDCEFSRGSGLEEIERHYSEQHYGPACPICYISFRKGYPQSDFEKHVNEHFSN